MATVSVLELEIWCTKVFMIFHREPLCITRDQENTTDGVVYETPLTSDKMWMHEDQLQIPLFLQV